MDSGNSTQHTHVTIIVYIASKQTEMQRTDSTDLLIPTREDEVADLAYYEEMIDMYQHPSKHLPTLDPIFKAIFGSSESKPVVEQFLNDVLAGSLSKGDAFGLVNADMKVQSVWPQHFFDVVEPVHIVTPRRKMSFLNILVKITSGEVYLIQIQTTDLDNMAGRTRAFSQQLTSGAGYDKLKKHIIIVLSKKPIFKSREELHTKSSMTTVGKTTGTIRLEPECDYVELHNLALDHVSDTDDDRTSVWLRFIKTGIMTDTPFTYSPSASSRAKNGYEQAVELYREAKKRMLSNQRDAINNYTYAANIIREKWASEQSTVNALSVMESERELFATYRAASAHPSKRAAADAIYDDDTLDCSTKKALLDNLASEEPEAE